MLDLTLEGSKVPIFFLDGSLASFGYFLSICVLNVIPFAVADTGFNLVGTMSYS